MKPGIEEESPRKKYIFFPITWNSSALSYSSDELSLVIIGNLR